MVLAVIVFMGKISGDHLNPAVSVGFALRGDFPLAASARLCGGPTRRRDPGGLVPPERYPRLGHVRLELPGGEPSGVDAFLLEAVLTLGLVSVTLGTASGAQNVGLLGALGVGGYIALTGLWASPISDASMNPARTFGPNLVSAHFGDYWVYVAAR